MNQQPPLLNENSLGQLQRAEVPPYLFTRIIQKIRKNQELASPALSWSLGLGLLLLLLVNLLALTQTPAEHTAMAALAQHFQLLSDNHLYP